MLQREGYWALMNLELPVGKLAVVCWRPPLLEDELADFLSQVRRAVDNAPEPLVFFTDWRHTERFNDDIVDTVVWIMRRDNPRLNSNGILISPGYSGIAEHTGRIVTEANNATRRVFTDPEECRRYLAPKLTAEETEVLDARLYDDGAVSAARIPAARQSVRRSAPPPSF